MPAEYTECVKSYIENGVSEKAAKARCAAMFYKRHGMTVNEWAKKYGESMEYDYDEDMVQSLLMSMEPKVRECGKHTILFANIKTMDTSQLDDGFIEIVATKDGGLSYTEKGVALTWTATALRSAQKTWNNKPVSINHDDSQVHGKIKYSWFDETDNTLHQIIQLDDFLRWQVKSNLNNIGVSIEAFLNKFDDNFSIIDAEGKAVTIVLPPHRPACSQEDGCKILGEQKEPTLLTNTIEDMSTDETREISKEVDIMSEKKENETSVITAEQYNAVVAEKESLMEEIKAMKTKISELETFKSQKIAEERNVLLATIKEFGLDPSVYEKNDNEALKLIVSTAETIRKSIADEPIIDSGAKIESKKPDAQKSPEEIEAEETWAYVYGNKK